MYKEFYSNSKALFGNYLPENFEETDPMWVYNIDQTILSHIDTLLIKKKSDQYYRLMKKCAESFIKLDDSNIRLCEILFLNSGLDYLIFIKRQVFNDHPELLES